MVQKEIEKFKFEAQKEIELKLRFNPKDFNLKYP